MYPVARSFQKMGIGKWDRFLNKVEKPVNVVVDIVNGEYRKNFQRIFTGTRDVLWTLTHVRLHAPLFLCAAINGVVDDVRDATAIVVGAYRVDLAFSNVKDHDRLLLSLAKADGTPFTPEEVSLRF